MRPLSPHHPPSGRVLLSLLAVAAVLATSVGGLVAYRSLKSDAGKQAAPIWSGVEQGDFELAITERGEIEAVGAVEVRSRVKSPNGLGIAILRIVPEGTRVEPGDFLCELDSAGLREDRTLQRIAVNTAQAIAVEAKNTYETALIAKKEYLEGLFVQERQTLESEVFVAEENLSRAQEYLKYSERLAEKGYVNDLQLQADAFAVEKSRKELDAAKTKLDVLEKHTRAKTLKQLESDIVIADAKHQADKNSLKLEQDRLAEIEEQIAKCVITAPQAGTVVYAHDRDDNNQDSFVVEEGASIRERQAIFRLPELTQMRVKLKINESVVQQVEEGMPATVRPIGLNGVQIAGHIESINRYPEPTNWRRANVREYKSYVRIDEPSRALRSGMTTSVTVYLMRLSNAVQAPVQAVYAHQGQHYCFVQRGNRIEPVEVACGPTNDQFFVIESGLRAGDQVALNPRRLLQYVDMPEAASPAAEPPPADPAARTGSVANAAGAGPTRDAS